MRGTRGALGVLAAAVSLVALSTASASASAPVWAYCAKAAPKNTGAYADKACASGSPTHEGKYELVDGIGKGKPFKGKIRVAEGGNAKLWGTAPTGELNVECRERAFSGHYLAPDKVAGVVLSLKKCQTNISEETKSCVVQTVPLSGELGWIDQADGQAGLKLTSEADPEEGVMTEVTGCIPMAKLRYRGSVIGLWSPTETITKEPTLSFGVHVFEEEGHSYLINLPAFEGEEGLHILRDEVNAAETGFEWAPAGGYPAGLEAELHMKGEALMVR